ncbi:protein UPSTREAM OF FLC [Camellia sinensis]|uniref:protein UPSTREAM OF FLC n=1 Tax=Camellia sinensis TaxID=4442 RepID=UPI00103696A2|nr:protein UPSTREAM OF FLC [Camellia sinensis]XP_028059419.1 protein UPSTREAM OF FLC [Camellia sinensis]
MAVTSRGRTTTDLQISKKWKDRETSPERTKVWTEPPNKLRSERKVPVVYYLSRNGQLEHPHFMEVPLSSPEGLYLRDVINRLNFLRGKGMATMYSWSSKRSYKNGFVWHDLAENDFIYPAHGQEYVLKGSELLDSASICKSDHSLSSSFKKPPPENQKSGDECDFPVVVTRRRNQSWSSIDLHEYKVYKAECTGESAGRAAADASTQTDDKRRRRRAIREIEEEEEEEKSKESCENENQSTELSREEISPPPSDSSPETLDSLMKADGRVVLCPEIVNEDRTADNHPSGRLKAASVLMQLITCGSISFKDCGPTTQGKDTDHHRGFSLISHYKARLPRGGGVANQVGKDAEEAIVENPSFVGRVKMVEEKEYFSGSLIETKKEEFPALKRCSSYNADRTTELEVKEMEGVKAKCIPRKPKTSQSSTRKEGNVNEVPCSSSTNNNSSNRNHHHGSSKKQVVQSHS